MIDKLLLKLSTFKNSSKSCHFLCSILWCSVKFMQKAETSPLFAFLSWHGLPSRIIFFFLHYRFYLSCFHFQCSLPRMNRRIRQCWLVWFDTDSELWAFGLLEWDFPEIDNTVPVPFLPPTAYRDYRRNKRQGHAIPLSEFR